MEKTHEAQIREEVELTRHCFVGRRPPRNDKNRFLCKLLAAPSFSGGAGTHVSRSLRRGECARHTVKNPLCYERKVCGHCRQ